jgi:hypothetical protein
VTITISNTVVRTRFYIISTPRLKFILRFLFFRKVKVTLRYLSNKEGGLVYAHFVDLYIGSITTVRTNNKSELLKEALRS